MWTEDYRWHYDYVRLAWDTGFCFDKYKYPNLDKNKICLVDIDRIVRERDVASVERQIPTVVQFVLESDQAEVLDTNFVKMFRISQLSVEYLLFCKKYLDNTVVLLKKEMSKLKEENKELKLFTEELESHISTLTKHNSVAIFNCRKCPKVFSAEEYLDSHIKRRHSAENKESTATETDQLHSEIKQLKERLNVAEALLQVKDEKVDKENSDLENKFKVNEIVETFERFKEKVDNDIKMLQIEKNIYEDKYGKLLEVVLHYKNKENQSADDTGQQNSALAEQNTVDKIETTTQTEKTSADRNLQIEMVHNRNVYDFQDPSLSRENEARENVHDKIEQKISEFEEHIEAKISSGLCNIESQMQAFWGKLTELEVKRERGSPTHDVPSQRVPEFPTETTKPDIKPRTKFSKPNKIVDRNNEENAKKIKFELEQMYSKPKSVQKIKPEIKVVKPSNVMYDMSPSSEAESETGSGSIVEVLSEKNYEPKPSLSTLGKRSITSLRKASKSKEVIEKLREEIANILNDRLQDIGISPNWKGIPQKTFDKSLDIVQHQASLTKKSYPEFDSIKKSIEKSLQYHKDLKQTKRTAKINASPNRPPNVINISYRKRPRNDVKPDEKTSLVTIKNRSLYDTDSDSDSPLQPAKPISEEVPAYSTVIKELQKSQARNADTDSDVNSFVLPKEEHQNEPHTKSALKNYPSLGSLTKKKVIFDIDTDVGKVEEDAVAGHEVRESMSSIASSDLDRLQDVHAQKPKKDDSISDFDLSQL